MMWTKQIFVSGLRLLAILALVTLGVQHAYADPAVVINFDGDVCTMADSEFNFVFAERGKIVLTESRNGQFNVWCAAKGIANNAGRAVLYNFENTGGLMCGWFIGGQLYLTPRWQETLSASGNAKLVCHFNDSSVVGPP